MQMNRIHFRHIVLLHLRRRRTGRISLRKPHSSTAKGSQRHLIWLSLTIVASPLVVQVAVLVDI